ncbi:MAG: exostosin family protein [Candidatus Babeliales bacterium]|nr:exostosin family protein [Candidatus Babeliales bacterium]
MNKKLIFFLLSCLVSNTINSLIFHEYYLDLFKEEPVPTEYLAYKLLKKNPIKKNINYLAVPWTQLIHKNQLDKAPNIKLNGGFTICQHIDYEKIMPILEKIGINVLFAPHVNKQYKNITVLPFAHVAVNGISPRLNKDIFYSFIGLERTHWTRKEIFNMKHSKNTVIIERKDWHFWINKQNSKELELRQNKEKKEYQDVLARSIFSLCPRGTGASTIRFWESLKSGSVPVLIADDMMLPAGFDWNSCIIKLEEKNVKNIPTILSNISAEKYTQMSINCIKAYSLFSGKNFVRTIRDYFK